MSAIKLIKTSANSYRPVCIWLTGLSGAVKSTIATMLQCRLNDEGFNSYVLDGDHLRGGVNADLGFEDVDRKESLSRPSDKLADQLSERILDAISEYPSTMMLPYIGPSLRIEC